MRRAASVLACGVVALGGCKHETPHERMGKLLYQRDESGPPDKSRVVPVADEKGRVTPERIHGGII